MSRDGEGKIGSELNTAPSKRFFELEISVGGSLRFTFLLNFMLFSNWHVNMGYWGNFSSKECLTNQLSFPGPNP